MLERLNCRLQGKIMRRMDSPPVDLELARRTLEAEAASIVSLARHIGEDFARAARLVYDCRGHVVLTGMGKAGIIAQKISGTLASTGTPSIFLHPSEAMHGDLGRLVRGDVVIALSNSGATAELLALMDHLKARGAALLVVTASADSPLAQHADITLAYGKVEEACPLGLAPTVSTACMLALGDALALAVMRMRRFQPEDFAAFHPGGGLALKFLKVEEAMLPCEDQRVAVVPQRLSLAEALGAAERARRVGAMLLVDDQGRLAGIFTDADLRRLLIATAQPAALMAQPISTHMKRAFKHVRVGQLASEAMAMMNEYRIDELPVLDDAGRPVGMIDVQDLVGIKTVGNTRD
jgi:arabinose-5-phosphate isomerase